MTKTFVNHDGNLNQISQQYYGNISKYDQILVDILTTGGLNHYGAQT